MLYLQRPKVSWQELCSNCIQSVTFALIFNCCYGEHFHVAFQFLVIFATFAAIEDSFLPPSTKSLTIQCETLTHLKQLHKRKKSIAKL